jgi:chromosome segregation ATPase
MKALGILLVSVSLISGCGRNEQTPQPTGELSPTGQQLEKANRQVAELQTELQGARNRIAELAAELERLKAQDSNAFAEAGQLLQSGRRQDALLSYRAFVRNFPASPYVALAHSQIKKLEDDQKQRAIAVDAEEVVRKRQQELANRARTNALNSVEWATVLRGKTRHQLLGMLGEPDVKFEPDAQWGYSNRFVHGSPPIQDVLVIHFNDQGVVRFFSQSLRGMKIDPSDPNVFKEFERNRKHYNVYQ